jgi:hypothetical protein
MTTYFKRLKNIDRVFLPKAQMDTMPGKGLDHEGGVVCEPGKSD